MDKRIITFLVVLLLCIPLVGIDVAWDKTDDNIKSSYLSGRLPNGKHLRQKSYNPSDFKYVNNGNGKKNGLEIATKKPNSINAHFSNGRLYLSQNKHDVHTIRILPDDYRKKCKGNGVRTWINE